MPVEQPYQSQYTEHGINVNYTAPSTYPPPNHAGPQMPPGGALPPAWPPAPMQAPQQSYPPAPQPSYGSSSSAPVPAGPQKVMRTAGGKKWEDSSLKDWPNDDFRCNRDVSKDCMPSPHTHTHTLENNVLSVLSFFTLFCSLTFLFSSRTGCSAATSAMRWTTPSSRASSTSTPLSTRPRLL